jgi:hypothetical protein
MCGEACAISTKLLDDRRERVYLTPQEAFVAFAGGGLPEESECSAARVAQLLKGARVKDVTTRHIQGTSRCALDSIELEDGTKLYLGASTHGASVYRVQAPHSYTRGAGG